jgi:hypothetical protein
LAIPGLVAAAGILGHANRAAADSPVVIHACVNLNGANAGQTRIVAATQTCAKNETRISWSAGVSGFSCPAGEFVTGFSTSGAPVCAAPSGGGGGGGGGAGTDADGDGIPDALDSCPLAPNLFYNGGSYCPASLYDVTLGSLGAGATVVLSNLHVDSVLGSTIMVSVQPTDPGYLGPTGSVLSVNLGSLAVPPVGSRVNLIGMVIDGGGFSPAAIVVTAGP